MEIAAWFHKRVRRPLLHRDPEQRRWRFSGSRMEGAVEVARRMGLPLVATSDAHYVNREDAEAQDVLLCINTGKFRTDTNRMRMEGDQFFLRSPEEMYAAFPGLRRGRCAQPGDRRHGRHRARAGQAALSRLSRCRRRRPPQDYLRELCVQGLQGALRRRPETCCRDGELAPSGDRAARARAGGDQQAGLSQLLPDRLGLRALRPRAGHSGHGARQRRRLAGVATRCT